VLHKLIIAIKQFRQPAKIFFLSGPIYIYIFPYPFIYISMYGKKVSYSLLYMLFEKYPSLDMHQQMSSYNH